MIKRSANPRLPQESLSQTVALVLLLVLGALAIAGPGGLIAWGETARQLADRKAEADMLTRERDALRNRVALLDPDHADPDLVGELLRRSLNVAHPDEMVIIRR